MKHFNDSEFQSILHKKTEESLLEVLKIQLNRLKHKKDSVEFCDSWVEVEELSDAADLQMVVGDVQVLPLRV